MFKAKTADNPLQHRVAAFRIPFDTHASTLTNTKVIEDVWGSAQNKVGDYEAVNIGNGILNDYKKLAVLESDILKADLWTRWSPKNEMIVMGDGKGNTRPALNLYADKGFPRTFRFYTKNDKKEWRLINQPYYRSASYACEAMLYADRDWDFNLTPRDQER